MNQVSRGVTTPTQHGTPSGQAPAPCFLEDPRNFQIVAEQESRLVSSIAMMYHPWNDSYELGGVLTRPDSRRRGLAPLLMQRVVDCVCAEALGEVFFSFRRARGTVDLCASLDPPMIVAGHAAGRNAANGSPGTQLVIFSIPSHARFVHVTPPVAESTSGAFVRERIYRPLRLPLAPGEYPPDSVVGATSDWSLEWGNLVVDYNPTSPGRTLEILAIRAGSSLHEHFSGDLDQLLRAIPAVEHITVTVLADKIELLRCLSRFGFELAAYLPAWYKGGAFRYDCVQLVKRRHAEAPMARECGDVLSRLQPEIGSILAHPVATPRPPSHRCIRTEDPDMSNALSHVTFGGLPVLAVIGDMHADVTSSAPEPAAEVTAVSDLQTRGAARQGPESNPCQEGVGGDVVTRVMGVLLLGLLMAAGALAPGAAAANPACNALIAGHVTLTANMNCTASATHGLRLSANTTLNCAGFTITGPDGAKPNGASTGHYGLRASNVGGIAIEHCNVTAYERGLYFSSVHDSFVNHSNFYGNTRYGANLVGPDSYGLLFDANTYHSNGDEGIHISGPMNNGLTKPNKFTNSRAHGNVGEGFYLLSANNVQLHQITTFDNGLAGVYVKQSLSVIISHAHLINDMMHVYGNSDAGAYSWVTIQGGRLKLQKGTAGSPSSNSFDHVCVLYDAANSQPSAAFYLEGVTAGSNSITNSKAALIAGKNSVVAIGTTTDNSVTSLYISPPTITTSVDGSSSFTKLTTQTTKPPLCYYESP